MKDSVTYQAIVEEGRVEERQEVLLQLGRKRFTRPDSAIESAVRDITDLDRLERMTEALLDVSSWEELLATP